ncbi:rubredoxin [Algoriphagus boritolerans]|uniref:rubredoxin n=1 Tax=Algoriphagus boritolerans TaxID=308111 RepID=UPI000B28B000
MTQGIPAETPFENLPEDYHCPLCEAPKSSFLKKDIRQAGGVKLIGFRNSFLV